MTNDEQRLYELAERRAAEKGATLEITGGAPWEAKYMQDSPLGSSVLQGGGPSATRAEALRLLLAIDDLSAQTSEHTA
jgi:hypothetical protein